MDIILTAPLPSPFRWAEAQQAGVTRRQLRQCLQLGLVRRCGPGLYRRCVPLAEQHSWEMVREEHLNRCADLLRRFPGHTASHVTAAAAHGFELVLHPEQDVHLTAVERVPRSRHVAGAQLHHADSIENDTVVVGGLRVTTIARTLADMLRSSRPGHSVAALDCAVRQGRVTEAQVRAVLDGQVRWRGRPRAREALLLHDPRRESWLESFSFVALHQRGLPMPQAQVDILDEGFHFVGRVDGLIESTGTFLEADGAGKYLIPARDQGLDEAASIALTRRAEGIRHERLVDLGLTAARWSTAEIMHAEEVVAARVWAAMRAGDPRRFRGWLRRDGVVSRLGEALPT